MIFCALFPGDYFHFHEDGSGYFSLSGLMARTDPSHEIEDATRVAMDTMKGGKRAPFAFQRYHGHETVLSL